MDNENQKEQYIISSSEIVKLFKENNLEKKESRGPKIEKPNGQQRVRGHEGLPLMERCQLILGKRMTERRGVGYLLDGVPVSCDRLLKEAKLR